MHGGTCDLLEWIMTVARGPRGNKAVAGVAIESRV
jgi:hypothetical protein